MPHPIGPLSASGTVAADGSASIDKVCALSHFTLVYATCMSEGSASAWSMGKYGSQLVFQNGTEIVMGPVILGPNEPAQIRLSGATAGTQANAELWGWEGDDGSATGSELASFFASILSAGSLTVPVTVTVSNSMQLIASQTLTADGSFQFTNIPQTFNHLRVVVRGATTLADRDNVQVNFNADFTANYSTAGIYEVATLPSPGVIGPGGGQFAITTGISGALSSEITIEVPGYVTPALRRGALGKSYHVSPTTFGQTEASGDWASTAAVTQIDVYNQASNFAAGGVAWLYGY